MNHYIFKTISPPYGGEMEAFSWWTSANYPGLIFLSSDEIDGASSLCYNLRRGLHCEVYEWSFSNGTDSPMSRMQYTDKNGEVRVVMAYMDDPRWVFYQSGKLLPFEDESNYSRRFIKKRFNFDIQKQYLSRMGISLSNIDENVTFCKTLKRVAWGKDEDEWENKMSKYAWGTNSYLLIEKDRKELEDSGIDLF